jgi:tRNA threonylcarbamoyladenosine biosynthesis protein TsaE
MVSASVDDTDRLGRAIGRSLHGGETLALVGTLGAGKTVMVRGIASGLGAAQEAVSSPTFVLIHEYRGRLPLAHVDLYRIGSLHELESTGVVGYFAGTTVTAIEWANKALPWLPNDRLEIELHHLTAESRRIRLTAGGPVSARLLSETKRRLRRAGIPADAERLKSKKA